MHDVILTFGKFKGRSISEILEIQPSYIAWAASKGLVPIDQPRIKAALQAFHEQGILEESVTEYRHGDWGNRD